MENDMDNITKDLEPIEVLGCYIAEALDGGYRYWIPRWSWNLNKNRASRIASCLRDFGITNELMESLPRFKEILERGY